MKRDLLQGVDLEKCPLKESHVPGTAPDELREFVARVWTEHSKRTGWLLAYHDDGVLWGKVEAAKCILPESQSGIPAFRLATLQSMRIFAEDVELRWQRNGRNEWEGYRFNETVNESSFALEEYPFLLGNPSAIGSINDEFVRLENAGGSWHCVPLPAGSQFRLQTRKYFRVSPEGDRWIAVGERWVQLH